MDIPCKTLGPGAAFYSHPEKISQAYIVLLSCSSS